MARRAAVSAVTIRRIEAVEGQGRVAPATFAEVRRALERAGAEFIQNGVSRRVPGRPEALFEELRSISLSSAERLKTHEKLTEADFYDEDGVPG